MRTIPAGEFKAKCLAILDEVKATGEPVLVTKRGKPVARVVVPVPEGEEKPVKDSIFGFLRGYGSLPEGVDPVESMFSDEEWKRFEDIEVNRMNHGEPE
jgi:prevent-host-death family protein